MAINGSVVVSDALKYQGTPYVYGGWDCSKMVNTVVGRDLKMAIPGYAAGAYDGVAHGPAVAEWASWDGCPALPPGQAPSAGDIVIFNGIGPSGHMGIALGPNQMVSALDTELGTRVTPIEGYGPLGAPLSYHRLTGVAGTTANLTSAGSLTGGAVGELALALLAGAAIPAAMAGVILLGAVLVGLGGAAAITYLAARAAEA